MKPKCLTDGDFIHLFVEGAANRRAEKLLGHVVRCPLCSFRFDILRKLHRDLDPTVRAAAGMFRETAAGSLMKQAVARGLEATPVPTPSLPVPSCRSGPFRLLSNLRFAAGLAAVLVIMGTAGIFLTRAIPSKRATLRASSLELSLIKPVGEVVSVPRLFQWSPFPGAESYQFRLYDDSLRLVHATGIYLVTEYLLPADVHSRLMSGRSYYWSVKASDGSSSVLASRSARFTWK